MYNNSYQGSIQMTPYEALYGRSCRSPLYWLEVRDRPLLGSDLVQQTTKAVKVIRRRLLTTQSRQKSYANRRRRPFEFQEGDHVFLKISLRHGVQRFGRAGKLAPRFIRPFQILERMGMVAYRLTLPPQLVGIHGVFHMSMLWRYHRDLSHILDWFTLDIGDKATFETRPIRIADKQEK